MYSQPAKPAEPTPLFYGELIPYPYQEEAIELGQKTNLLLMDEPGTGKTLMAVEIIKRLRETGKMWFQRPAIIFCPKQTAAFWKQTIIRQSGGGNVYIAEPKAANIPPARQLGPRDWIIAHYETILARKDWQSIRWSVVVCDEAHRIKNRNAKRVIALKKLPATRAIALTGTPMERSAGDLWSILNWLFPGDWRSYWAFYTKYVEEEVNQYTGFRKIKGSKNLADLTAKMSSFTLRRTKLDVAPQLPPRPVPQHVPVTMESHQASLYKQTKKVSMDEAVVDKGADINLWIKNTLSRIVRLQQVSTEPELLGMSAQSAKLEWLYDFLEDNPDEVCVVFTRFRDTAIRLHKRFHPDSLLIVGGVQFAGWQSGRLCVGTIASMSEGINLQRATTAIFLDQEWSTIKMTQAVDRIHRIDDMRPKTVYYLHTEGTVDSLILKALDRKWADIDLVNAFLEER